MKARRIFIDPPSKAFYENRFFTDSELNRDHCLRPYIILKEKLHQEGIELNTFDFWESGSGSIEYYSFGMLDNLDDIAADPDVKMKGFYIFEPPVVDPSIYQSLPKLTSMFEEVYVHNTHGNGYSLDGVITSKLKKLFWPQPFDDVLEPYWQNKIRQKKIVVINGNHKPAFRHKELYSERIKVMVELSEMGGVDLYGRGWKRWFSRSSLWIPYWKNRKKLLSIYKGSCISKFEVLSQYEFCLCFENMVMDGYMTEKLFDCLYAGCIPIYFGAPDVGSYVDPGAYIDYSLFRDGDALFNYITNLSQDDIEAMRAKGKEFLRGNKMADFYNSLSLSLIKG